MHSETHQFVLRPQWILPVNPAGVLLENHCLVVQDSQIVHLGQSDALPPAFAGAKVIDLPGKILLPGLVNTHGHAAMTLLRGYADDLALMDWLNNHIWPVEGEFVSHEFVLDGTTLAVAEMIRSGTTCAADTYFFPDAVATAFRQQHFRGQVCMPVIQFPNAWASSEDEHIHKGLQFRDDFIKNNDLLTTAFAPHSPYTVTNQGFEKTLLYSEELQIPIHLHLHETAQEVSEGLALHNSRPFARMQSLGLLSPLLQTVHMTQLTDDEIEALAINSVHVAHCPESNLKLASGFCEVAKLRAAGVNVGIGTDGAASNNNLDMLEEMRTAAILAKNLAGDPATVNAHEAVAMATIHGARLLGLDHAIGSLEPGKQADMIAVDLTDISLQPLHHPVSQLVYAASGQHVSDVWIAGRQLLKQGQLTELDVTALRAKTETWRQRIAQRGRS
ncbi:MAG: TRZ/ATZ family hydrolase [Pseudomonadales bacterium]|nr:TRZ/ATZ family hydrolase [Pseudomonadales bacterium]